MKKKPKKAKVVPEKNLKEIKEITSITIDKEDETTFEFIDSNNKKIKINKEKIKNLGLKVSDPIETILLEISPDEYYLLYQVAIPHQNGTS